MTTPHRNSPARAAMLADRATAQLMRMLPRFTPIPGRPSLSTRGQRTASWLTKAHTPSRIRDMKEARS